MKFAVVGSRGYIGERLCDRLTGSAFELDAYSTQQPGGIDPQTGRFRDDFRFSPDVDAVVYLAQSPWSREGPANPAHVLSVNVLSAAQAASAAVACGASRFLYASTGNVYKPSFKKLTERDALTLTDWYALSKVHAEQALSRFAGDIDVHILRLFGVYGPGQTGRLIPTLIHRVKNREPVFLDKGEAGEKSTDGLRLSLTYIQDVVEIFVQVAEQGGPPLMNVASDQILSIREISEQIGLALGQEPVFEMVDKKRDGDLIADNALIKGMFRAQFASFEYGIGATVDGHATT